MRLFSRIFVAIVMICLLGACEKDEENIILNTPSEFTLNGNGEERSIITFTASAGEWSASSQNSWCSISVESGQYKSGAITVTVEPNLSLDSRVAIITISSPNSDDVSITVTQEPAEGMSLLSVNKTELNFDAESGESSFILTSGAMSWSATTPVEWFIFTPSIGSDGSAEIVVSVEANSGSARSGYITITGPNSIKTTVKIYQSPAPFPSYAVPIDADLSGVESTSKQLVGKIKLGWNLGNSMEVPSGETGWGNPKTSQSLIDAIKAAGFNAVRIPCAWNGYADATTGKIKDSWLTRVKEVVDYCVSNEMYVVLNIHWDGGWLEENPNYSAQEEVNMKQKAYWEQISMFFRDYDEHLLFAGTNEVHDGYGTPTSENLSVQMSFNQVFVDAVRSTGGKNAYRNIIVQSYNTNISLAYDKLKLPTDKVTDRMIVEVHYYDPWDFCGAGSDSNDAKYYWGKEGGYTTGISTWAQEDHVRSQFANMKSKFVDKGYPVIMGEYGAVNRTLALATEVEKTKHQESRAYYLKYVTQKMKEYGIAPFYWDNGFNGTDGFAIFNRNTKLVSDQTALDALVSGANLGVYPF